MNEFTVAQLPVGSLKPHDCNARTHSAKQIAQIKDGGIIAGHGRVEAARRLGLATVPCVRLDHLDEAQKRAYILADNKLADKAGWDPEILKIELQHLMSSISTSTSPLPALRSARSTSCSAPASPIPTRTTPGRRPRRARPSRAWAISGRSAGTGSSAATPRTPPPTVACSPENARRWCSPTRPTT